ncbi:MAG: HAD-IA family hydrolase [Candidatus Eisenbacteria bacterium]|nr:HAD-IA family hydrolase [Candidatus Latescibacterota bacterium]MBD3302072.1 HAD-IA family hydrolase [Candidatus Eisenbacteria bacterium]
MSPIRGVAIDLFNTLVHIDPTRYPTVTWEGRPRLSSAPILLEIFRSWDLNVEPARYIAASIEVQDEMEKERRIEHREIPSLERFRRTLERVGIDPETDGGRLLRILQRTHIDSLVDAARLPVRSLLVLAMLAARHPVVLVSNFDDGAACRRLLERRGIASYLSGIVISEEIGLRKPDRTLFERAAALAGCACEEMLFVGDSPVDDIEGARAVGMKPVWIRGEAPPPPNWRAPEPTLDHLADLLDLGLGEEGSLDAIAT